jgi:hypothetical protein
VVWVCAVAAIEARSRVVCLDTGITLTQRTGDSHEEVRSPGPRGDGGFENGLLLYSRRQNGGKFGDWLLIAPPLILDRELAESILERLESTLTGAVDELQAAARHSSA